jgi:hypothetical protein
MQQSRRAGAHCLGNSVRKIYVASL